MAGTREVAACIEKFASWIVTRTGDLIGLLMLYWFAMP
jgi:hypothetical protein